MSRQYRVKVRETLRRVVKARDEVSSQLEILEILPAAEMAELLAEELQRRGFKRKGNNAIRKQEKVEVLVDLATGTVTVRASDEKDVNLSATREGYGDRDVPPGRGSVRERIAEQLRESLEKDAGKVAAQLQSKVSDELECQLGDVAAELDQAVNRATAEALKRKAAQLGRIKQMVDDAESGALTIVVEV
jgi:hypothetical protein